MSKVTLYKRYFIRFVAVLLIPTLILGSVVSYFIFYILSRSAMDASQLIFSLVDKELSSKVDQLSNCRRLLTADLTVAGESLYADPYEKYQMIRRLKDISEILGFCSDVGVVNLHQQQVISSLGESAASVYFQKDNQPFLQQLSQMPESQLSHLYAFQGQISTRFVYFSRLNTSGDTYLFFTFDAFHLTNKLSSVLTEWNAQVQLVPLGSDQLLPLNDSQDAERVLQAFQRHQAAPAIDTSNGYMVRTHTLERFGFTLYSAIPTQRVFSSVLVAVVLSVSSMAITLALGLSLVRHMTRKNYQPIGQIMSSLAIPSGESGASNELEEIYSALDNMQLRMTDLTKSLDGSKENIKKSLLVRLLYGQFHEESDFLQEAAPIGISTLHQYYFVCVISFAAQDDLGPVYSYLCGVALEHAQCMALNNGEHHQLILLLNYSDPRLQALEVVKTIKRHIFEDFGLESTIGLSHQAGDFASLPDLFLSACNALSYCFISGKYNISTAPQTILEAGQPHLADFDLDAFESCIIESDNQGLVSLLYDKFEEIRSSALPLNRIKMYLFDMVCSIRRMLSRFDLSDQERFDRQLTDAILLTDSVEELFNQLYQIASELGQQVENVSAQQKLDSICRYIQQRYCDPSLSVNAVSDHLGLSVSALSRFFKKHYGCNISDYIFDLKIKRAKELLRTTAKSVEVIVDEVGYQNTSSFIRRFKASEGLTPGQYRALK